MPIRCVLLEQFPDDSLQTTWNRRIEFPKGQRRFMEGPIVSGLQAFGPKWVLAREDLIKNDAEREQICAVVHSLGGDYFRRRVSGCARKSLLWHWYLLMLFPLQD